MNKYYYHHKKQINTKLIGRIVGGALSLVGVIIMVYIFLPLIIWQITLAPVFAAQSFAVPIPKTTLVSGSTIQSLLTSEISSIGVDYTNAANWFPGYVVRKGDGKVPNYFISIPSIGVKSATVSTVDMDLGSHLIHLGGTALPPEKGTAVIFGHSTLPQLFDPKNYHTIFANAYKVQLGDEIDAVVENVTYKYKVFSITVVDPSDTDVLAQNTDDSYLEVITCTPPGTVWKRLIILSRLEKL
ncbi:MAG TPA: sortase [Patescibacteria group bacterium]|nr:sortase [Patescibacteria group bacterium]